MESKSNPRNAPPQNETRRKIAADTEDLVYKYDVEGPLPMNIPPVTVLEETEELFLLAIDPQTHSVDLSFREAHNDAATLLYTDSVRYPAVLDKTVMTEDQILSLRGEHPWQA